MKNLLTAILMTIVTTDLLGLIYPLAVTGLAQLIFPDQANGQLIRQDGVIIGSRLIGQPFTGPGYFHSRPSAAGPAGWGRGLQRHTPLRLVVQGVLREQERRRVGLASGGKSDGEAVGLDAVPPLGNGRRASRARAGRKRDDEQESAHARYPVAPGSRYFTNTTSFRASL